MHNIPASKGIQTSESTPSLLAEVLNEELPEVEHAVAVVNPSWNDDSGILSFENQRLKAKPQFVGENYFDVFTCQFSAGSQTDFLNKKQAVIISDELARKLFDSEEEPVGKPVYWEQLKGSVRWQASFRLCRIILPIPSICCCTMNCFLSGDLSSRTGEIVT